jgi:uncharacterized protein (TIGR02001 family)
MLTNALLVLLASPSLSAVPPAQDQSALVVAGPLDAPVPRLTSTATISLVSNYVFRGLTQTDGRPALQAGLAWGGEGGLYGGLWGSNVSWFADANPSASSSLELDLYAGYRGNLTDELTFDAGLVRYQYPGSYNGLASGVGKPDTTELYAGLSWRWIGLKGSYGLGDLFGVEDSAGSFYLDGTLSVDLPEQFTLGLHAGWQHYSGGNGATSNDDLFSYSDWSASLSREIPGGFVLGFTYTGTDAEDAGYTIAGENIGDGQWIVSLVKSW